MNMKIETGLSLGCNLGDRLASLSEAKRRIAAIPGTEGEFHVKTAFVAGMPYVAVKVASGFYGNAARGLPTVRRFPPRSETRTGQALRGGLPPGASRMVAQGKS